MSSRILKPAEVEYAPVHWGEFGPVGDELPAVRPPGRVAQEDAGSDHAAPPPDWESLVRQAREEGRREGEASARQAAGQELAMLQARLVQSIEAAAALRPRLRREAERQMVELALAVARRVLHREISLDPAAVAGLVRAALDQLSLREVLRVRCHTQLAAPIREELNRLGAPAAIHVEADPGLEAGAVLIEAARGTLDASVTTQLEEIERGFADLLEAPAHRP